MLIHCPICDAIQDDDASRAVRSGVPVECDECGYCWAASGHSTRAAEPAEGHAPEINVDAASERVMPTSYEPERGGPVRELSYSRQGMVWPRVSTGSMVAIVGVIVCMAAIARRETLVRLAPGAAPLFAAIRLPVNLRGLAFEHVRSRIMDEGGQRVLAVEGEVANLRPARGSLPDIHVAVRANDGREIYSWTSPAPKRDIGVGEMVYFRARLAAPPADGADVKLQFASMEPGRTAALKK